MIITFPFPCPWNNRMLKSKKGILLRNIFIFFCFVVYIYFKARCSPFPHKLPFNTARKYYMVHKLKIKISPFFFNYTIKLQSHCAIGFRKLVYINIFCLLNISLYRTISVKLLILFYYRIASSSVPLNFITSNIFKWDKTVTSLEQFIWKFELKWNIVLFLSCFTFCLSCSKFDFISITCFFNQL